MKSFAPPLVLLMSFVWCFQFEVENGRGEREFFALSGSSALVTALFFFAASGVLDKWARTRRWMLLRGVYRVFLLPAATLLLPTLNKVFPLDVGGDIGGFGAAFGVVFLVSLSAVGDAVGAQINAINERVMSRRRQYVVSEKNGFPLMGFLIMHIFYVYLAFFGRTM